MNLLITTVCNRKCRFCFAKSRMDDKQSVPFMSREMIIDVMDMLEKEGGHQLRLLGGEPTLHPEFPEIINTAIERGFDILLFSNGMMPDAAVDAIERHPVDKVSILCNISPQADDHPSLVKRREAALTHLGSRMVPGLTISNIDEKIDMSMFLDTIERYGMKKQIRIGIAQPIVGRKNEHIAPKDYPKIGGIVAEMARQCIERDVLLGFDCGMTPCMFSGEEWEAVMTCTSGYKSVCHPIVDIGPDGGVWHCFPLAEVFNEKLSNFSNRKEIVEYYNEKLKIFRKFGCGPACVRCDFKRRGQCLGGCLAHAIPGVHGLEE